MVSMTFKIMILGCGCEWFSIIYQTLIDKIIKNYQLIEKISLLLICFIIKIHKLINKRLGEKKSK